MDYKAFSICFGSLHYPNLGEDEEVFASLSQESAYILNSLYASFKQRLVSARNPERFGKMLQDSIFCCCLPEGMAMLRASADVRLRTAALDGFLVSADTLRTAWKLSRWKLLFVCAAGWDKHGTVWLTLNEIEKIAMTLKVPDSIKAPLREMSQKMLESPIPFSFSITNLPNHMVPVHFQNTAQNQQNAAMLEDVSEITISADRAKLLSEKYQHETPVYRTLRLCCDSKKHYMAKRLQYDSEFEDAKDVKAQLKEELAQYSGDEIWYFSTYAVKDFYYIRPLSPLTTQSLSRGSVDFSEINGEMDRYIMQLMQYIEKLKKANAAAKTSSGGGGAKKTSPEQEDKNGRGNLLKSIFHKKKGDESP